MQKRRSQKCDVCDSIIKANESHFNPQIELEKAQFLRRRYNPDVEPDFYVLDDGNVDLNVCLGCYDGMSLQEKFWVDVNERRKQERWNLVKVISAYMFFVLVIIYFIINWLFLDESTSRELAGIVLVLLLGGTAFSFLWGVFRDKKFSDNAKSVLLIYNIFTVILFYSSDINLWVFLTLNIVASFMGYMGIGDTFFKKIKKIELVWMD